MKLALGSWVDSRFVLLCAGVLMGQVYTVTQSFVTLFFVVVTDPTLTSSHQLKCM